MHASAKVKLFQYMLHLLATLFRQAHQQTHADMNSMHIEFSQDTLHILARCSLGRQTSSWYELNAHKTLPRYIASDCKTLFKEGKSAINLSNLGNFCQILAPGHLFMLGRSAVPKMIFVRTAGGAENTSNIGENPNINNLTWLPRPSP